jgi:sec-independent protein translocase protein TatA
MFGIGNQELIIILIIAFFVFGAKNLPSLGKSLGQAITGFKKGLEDPGSPKEHLGTNPKETKPEGGQRTTPGQGTGTGS